MKTKAISIRELHQRTGAWVRKADALHLACAREHALRDVYTSDRHMRIAAPHYHVRAIAVGSG